MKYVERPKTIRRMKLQMAESRNGVVIDILTPLPTPKKTEHAIIQFTILQQTKREVHYLTFEDQIARAYIDHLISKANFALEGTVHYKERHRLVTTAKFFKRLKYLFNPMTFR